jgi:hypothetical protein
MQFEQQWARHGTHTNLKDHCQHRPGAGQGRPSQAGQHRGQLGAGRGRPSQAGRWHRGPAKRGRRRPGLGGQRTSGGRRQRRLAAVPGGGRWQRMVEGGVWRRKAAAPGEISGACQVKQFFGCEVGRHGTSLFAHFRWPNDFQQPNKKNCHK